MIHPSAIISPDASVADDVEIGPFAIIDAGCSIGAGCKIGAQAWITGNSQLGKNNDIGYGAVVGALPQSIGFDPATESGVIIGDNNTLREYVTINRSIYAGKNTVIGNDNFLMSVSHVAHDCILGDHNILANNVMLGGHIEMGNRIFLGGGGGFHQFVKIGSFAMVKGNASISQDVPPYAVACRDNELASINVVALRRAGFDAATRSEIKNLYKLLFRSGIRLSDAITQAEESEWSEAASALIEAAKSPSAKGILRKMS